MRLTRRCRLPLLNEARHPLADFGAGSMLLQPGELLLVNVQSDHLQLTVKGQLFGLSHRPLPQQPAEEVASLKTLTGMKQRIAKTIAVELGQWVKRIHVAKVEQPDGSPDPR